MKKLTLFDIVLLIVFIAYIILVFVGLYIVDPNLIIKGAIACIIAFLVPLTIVQIIIYFINKIRYKKGLPMLDMMNREEDSEG